MRSAINTSYNDMADDPGQTPLFPEPHCFIWRVPVAHIFSLGQNFKWPGRKISSQEASRLKGADWSARVLGDEDWQINNSRPLGKKVSFFTRELSRCSGSLHQMQKIHFFLSACSPSNIAGLSFPHINTEHVRNMCDVSSPLPTETPLRRYFSTTFVW